MDFSVVRSSGGLVPPASVTPSGILQLSVMDKLAVLRCYARTLHVFRHGPGAAQVIREALAKALVPYYPLAGRLKESSHGELQIACSGEGVWFVEATADCSLDVVNDLEDALSIPYDKLLPDRPLQSQGEDPLLLMQVTQFACDGFVIGLTFCHTICDGLGAAQFFACHGELARGVDHLTVAPVWHRDFLPPSPQDHQECPTELGAGRPPAAAPPIMPTASLWKNRTEKAILDSLDKDREVKLVFFANCRPLMHPPLPQGFYGNCFFPVTITASTQGLSRASYAQVVEMIQEAKASLPIELDKWIKDDELNGEDPFAPPLAYTTLFISEWGRLGFNQVDYGWGPPLHVVPIQGSAIIPVGILSSMPFPKKGIRLMTWCVENAHLHPFLQQMAKLN
ncbi:HXXXD-type acyl-transferase family protein [Actinidia rufa]|uniref:HXXXD-type acyl-transferase family protein n=1 Tax=Actinidia rufa TaxID=165716 RepID=A0A7J0G0H5_9ERIC|nr:HXXXD-type acyl-transferase family protein [Actinidia rufa]